jgi:aminoglycoside N3'-acetyltransferase
MSINAFTEKMLNEVFGKYKAEATSAQSGENIELEIRFKDITREAFEEIYKHVSASDEFSNATLECSINVISENVYERNIGGKADET